MKSSPHEPEKSHDMPPSAHITLLNVATGEKFTVHDDWTKHDLKSWDWTPSLHNVYWSWTDGNCGCDCNRHAYYCRHKRIEEGDDNRCGEEERYKLVKFTPVKPEGPWPLKTGPAMGELNP